MDKNVFIIRKKFKKNKEFSQKILIKIKKSKLNKLKKIYKLLNKNKLIRNNTYQNILFLEKRSCLSDTDKLEIYKFKINKKFYKIVFLLENEIYSGLYFVSRITKKEFINTEKEIFDKLFFMKKK